jgi:hypothetical protein
VGFAVDYLVLVLTATPFFLMAHALSPTVTYKVGYLWYFVFYISLLGFGLLLLLIAEIRHLRYLRVRLLRETIPIEEVRRENVLRAYWLLMNGTALLILVLGFRWPDNFTPAQRPRMTRRFRGFLYSSA